MANGNFGGGSGTNQDPYLVEDAQDLNAVRNNLAASYKQVADIDLSEWGNWNPIGDTVNFILFSGSYYGNGCKILNMNCQGGEFGGLFAANEGYITDLGLVNPFVRSTYASSLVAANIGSITGCFSENVDVRGEFAGGLVAYNSFQVKNCYCTGKVVSSSYIAGGLVGENESSVSNSYSTCQVSSDLEPVIIRIHRPSVGWSIPYTTPQGWKDDGLTVMNSDYFRYLDRIQGTEDYIEFMPPHFPVTLHIYHEYSTGGPNVAVAEQNCSDGGTFRLHAEVTITGTEEGIVNINSYTTSCVYAS